MMKIFDELVIGDRIDITNELLSIIPEHGRLFNYFEVVEKIDNDTILFSYYQLKKNQGPYCTSAFPDFKLKREDLKIKVFVRS